MIGQALKSADSGVSRATISDASQTGLDITGSMTLMAWYRSADITKLNLIAGKWDFSGAQRGYSLAIDSAGKIRFVYSDNGTTAFTGLAVTGISGYRAFKWYHLAAVFISATPTVQFYVDGVASGTPVALGGTGSAFNNTAAFVVGNLDGGSASATDNFRGLIDMVKVYDDERSAGEIAAEYLLDPVVESNLVAGYKFEDDLVDVSGNGNTLANDNVGFGSEFGNASELNNGSRLIGGNSKGGNFNYYASSITGDSAGGGGGAPVIFRMRGIDGTLGYPVYWNSDVVDTPGADYAGPGPLTDVVLSEKIAA